MTGPEEIWNENFKIFALYEKELEECRYISSLKDYHVALLDYILVHPNSQAAEKFKEEYCKRTEIEFDELDNLWVKPIPMDWFEEMTLEEIEQRFISSKDRQKWERFRKKYGND